MTSPDMGYYLDWKMDQNGYPYGCDIFDTKTNDQIGNGFKLGPSDCKKQTLREINGKKGLQLWKRVEFYAENQEEWLIDFAKSFEKMLANGYKKKQLTTGPRKFWTFDCK